ncbi:inorganic diphosphatase [Candidatus Parcubacteria bacterium]|nr:inorganic diphosphatase [Candidatus Parcubacteria bacterium]
MNLWHDVEPGSKEAMNVIVEINKGSKNKYEVDKKTGLIALDRVMHTGQDYPFDYGFVPKSLWHDGDPLDVIILSTYPFAPGVMVSCRPVAVMHMVDTGEADEKIIAVPVNDPRFNNLKDLSDINPHTLKEIEHFWLTYKQIQNKEVKINGTSGRAEAEASFEEGLKLYQEKFPTS